MFEVIQKPVVTFSSLSGRKAMETLITGYADTTFRSQWNLPDSLCVLLTGEAGCGKKTLAAAAVRTMMDAAYPVFSLNLMGWKDAKEEEISEWLKAIEKRNAMLLIEHLEMASGKLQRLLYQFLYRIKWEQRPILVLLVETECIEKKSYRAIRDLCMKWKLDRPDLAEQCEYYEKELMPFVTWEDQMEAKQMAEQTAGMTFAQVADVVRYIKFTAFYQMQYQKRRCPISMHSSVFIKAVAREKEQLSVSICRESMEDNADRASRIGTDLEKGKTEDKERKELFHSSTHVVEETNKEQLLETKPQPVKRILERNEIGEIKVSLANLALLDDDDDD